MVLYSVILFLVAIPFYAVSIAIYRGKTHLICDYHQKNVTDPAAYGKAFGKAMLVIAAALLISGLTGLLCDPVVAVAALVVGLAIGIACIVAVQKKYNQGVF